MEITIVSKEITLKYQNQNQKLNVKKRSRKVQVIGKSSSEYSSNDESSNYSIDISKDSSNSTSNNPNTEIVK